MEKPHAVVPFTRAQAAPFIEAHHYSRSLPSNASTNFAALNAAGEVLAVACYGPPVSRVVPKEWKELRRLVRVPGARVFLSSFLSKTVRLLKAQGTPAIISYADPDEGHHGGIYQACGWVCSKNTRHGAPKFFYDPDGNEVHPRTMYARYGTQDEKAIKAMMPGWTTRHKAVKVVYVRALSLPEGEVLAALNTQRVAYPKPLFQ